MGVNRNAAGIHTVLGLPVTLNTQLVNEGGVTEEVGRLTRGCSCRSDR